MFNDITQEFISDETNCHLDFSQHLATRLPPLNENVT